MIKRVVSLGCIDFRMNRRKDGRDYMGEFIARLGFDCFPVTRAGSVQDLIRPSASGYKESILRDIGVGVKGHGAEAIIAINHENCAAYAHFKFKNREDEIIRHKGDLLLARGIINEEFPDIFVDLYFAELVPGTKDFFVIKHLLS